MANLMDLSIFSPRNGILPSCRGLIHIARNCPNLSKLTLVVNSSAHQEDSLPSFSHKHMSEFTIFNLPPGVPNHTATLIQTDFPNLAKLESQLLGPDDNAWRVVVEKLEMELMYFPE